jgi:uncharacterized SAM-binding protein YcdF (DUF218 family)
MNIWLRRMLGLSAALVALWCMLPSVLNTAARQLMRTDPLEPADAIAVLGGDSLGIREGHAAELYHHGYGRKLIISGLPFAWGGNTGDAKRRFLNCRGVPDEAILVLPVAWNTRSEASNLQAMMVAQGWHSMIIVTSPYHARRALFTIERRVPEPSNLKFYSSPVPARPPEWQPERWWTRRRDVFKTVREFLSWGNTLLGGWQ